MIYFRSFLEIKGFGLFYFKARECRKSMYLVNMEPGDLRNFTHFRIKAKGLKYNISVEVILLRYETFLVSKNQNKASLKSGWYQSS